MSNRSVAEPSSTTTGRRSRARFRRRAGKGLMTIGSCFIINMLTTPSFQWWLIPAFAIAGGLVLDWAEARDRSHSGSRRPGSLRTAPLPSRRDRVPFGDEHLGEAKRLRGAVEDLLSRLSRAQRELLGDVQTPVSSLESRVEALVHQGRQVDAELSIHDEQRIEQKLADARQRVDSLAEGAQRAEEQATLEVLEKQHETLSRVLAHRSRIDARLRTAVGMMRALHLDLVELVSTDLDGSSGTIQRMGDQVREVSRSVDALAAAVDEVMLEDHPPREKTVSPRRPSRGRSRS